MIQYSRSPAQRGKQRLAGATGGEGEGEGEREKGTKSSSRSKVRVK